MACLLYFWFRRAAELIVFLIPVSLHLFLVLLLLQYDWLISRLCLWHLIVLIFTGYFCCDSSSQLRLVAPFSLCKEMGRIVVVLKGFLLACKMGRNNLRLLARKLGSSNLRSSGSQIGEHQSSYSSSRGVVASVSFKHPSLSDAFERVSPAMPIGEQHFHSSIEVCCMRSDQLCLLKSGSSLWG